MPGKRSPRFHCERLDDRINPVSFSLVSPGGIGFQSELHVPSLGNFADVAATGHQIPRADDSLAFGGLPVARVSTLGYGPVSTIYSINQEYGGLPAVLWSHFNLFSHPLPATGQA